MCTDQQKKKNVSHPVCTSSWGWSGWCSSLGSHTIDRCPFHSLLSATFSHLSALLSLSLFKLAPNCHAEVQSGVPKCDRAVTCLMEKIHVLDKLHSGMSYRTVGCEFNFSEYTKIFSKLSLNAHTETTKLCVDQLTKMLWPEARRNLIVFSLGAMIQYSLMQNVTTANNKN